jgi:hypothetical protein
VLVGGGLMLAAASFSCAADSGVGGQGGSAASGTGASAASGGAGANGLGGDIGFGGDEPGGSGQGGGDSCAGETATAQPVPLDMYIMLDRSGSMTEATGVAAVTKWQAVTSGLASFLTSPDSTGLGVALQFFPLNAPGVPDSCTTNAQCGTGAPCFLSACEMELYYGQIVPCGSNSDCTYYDCIPLGECTANTNYVCVNFGTDCGTDDLGNPLGTCVDMTESYCANGLTCNAADYGAPAVAMGTLPDAATGLNQVIGQQSPFGNTPTFPALQGAVSYALGYKQQNLSHAVVAVLATDGIPTQCDPLDAASIAAVAAGALAGDPSVPTFVIGVISPSDPGAQATLDQIAAAGGTTEAFIVDPNGDVTQAFLDALNEIRGSALACEYVVPQPEPPEQIDYGMVNVEHTPLGSPTANTIPYVGNEAGCDPVAGGWYYDVDPAQADPTSILMCPATCQLLMGGGDLVIRVGCETVVPR